MEVKMVLSAVGLVSCLRPSSQRFLAEVGFASSTEGGSDRMDKRPFDRRGTGKVIALGLQTHPHHPVPQTLTSSRCFG
ncbi:unnamed protein product, partial [Nesidiocoris tenuis]